MGSTPSLKHWRNDTTTNQQPTNQPTNTPKHLIVKRRHQTQLSLRPTYKELTERIIHAMNVMNIGPIHGINANVQLLCFI